jgi:hypothetical protein
MPQSCNCDATVKNIYSHLQSCTMPVWRYCDVGATFSMYFNTQSDFSTTWGIFLFQKWSKMFQNFPEFFRTNFRRSFEQKFDVFSMKKKPNSASLPPSMSFRCFFQKKLCQMRINCWSKKNVLKKFQRRLTKNPNREKKKKNKDCFFNVSKRSLRN